MSGFSATRVRELFLEFFQNRGHQIVAPIPIVVKDDPSLMFTNAGMNAFKDIFLDLQKPNFTRVANSQPCLRVSGKHNDLEEVGVDNYHHTLFEMLGNWSFGNYFKEQAIAWAWELITQVYALDTDRLYVTVFAGNEKDGVQADTQSAEIWRNFLPKERILHFDAKDNFWEMGDTGPCGPCTEIHFDGRTKAERADVPGHLLVNQGHSELIEIWNLVFIEFMRNLGGNLSPLKQKHVDTGMGLERLVRILQDKQSNYDTDLFTPLLARVSELTGIVYTHGTSHQDIAFRVLADHIRAIAFCLSEGATLANTGAGYVIKRIMRRAIRYYYTHLNWHKPLLYQLLPVLSAQFRGIFPALHTQNHSLAQMICEEEEQFLRTIGQGMKRLRQYVDMHPSESVLAGAVAFELYDTYGFPLDVTQMVLQEENWQVDEPGFYKAMQVQKERSRRASAEELSEWIELETGTCEFVGYTELQIKTRVLRYRKVVQGSQTYYQIVLEKTPFYPEGGGQAGDKGYLLKENGQKIEILDTRRELGQIVHITKEISTDLRGDFLAQIDQARRDNLSIHHSATHLLHAALQKYLGRETQQRGSSITTERLRFDFACVGKIPPVTLEKISDLVNHWIAEKLPITNFYTKLDEAKKLGAMAIFGEKYGEQVRVVQIDQVSLELCGGTHVKNTQDLQQFRILQEVAVASGIRRIEAVAGSALQNFLQIEAKKEEQELVQVQERISQIIAEGEQILAELRKLNWDTQNLSDSWTELLRLNQNSRQVAEKKTVYSKVKAQIETMEKNRAQAYAHLLHNYLQNQSDFEACNSIFALQYCYLDANLLCVYLPNISGNLHNIFKNMLNYWRKQGLEQRIFIFGQMSAKTAVLLDLGANSGNAVDFLRREIAPLIGGGAGGGEKSATAGGRAIGATDLPKLFATLEQLKTN